MTLTFRLFRKARVVFTVTQLFPDCRLLGSFSIRGHRGQNNVPFTGRVPGRQLPPGTYQVSGRMPGGRTLLTTTIVIVKSGMPSQSALGTAQRSDVCSVLAGLESASRSGGLTPYGPFPSQHDGELVRNQQLASASAAGEGHSGLSLLSPAKLAENVSNPFVIAGLAAAVLLLGLAALPQGAIPDPRLTYLLVKHRVRVALAGTGAFAAALVALLVA